MNIQMDAQYQNYIPVGKQKAFSTLKKKFNSTFIFFQTKNNLEFPEIREKKAY